MTILDIQPGGTVIIVLDHNHKVDMWILQQVPISTVSGIHSDPHLAVPVRKTAHTDNKFILGPKPGYLEVSLLIVRIDITGQVGDGQHRQVITVNILEELVLVKINDHSLLGALDRMEGRERLQRPPGLIVHGFHKDLELGGYQGPGRHVVRATGIGHGYPAGYLRYGGISRIEIRGLPGIDHHVPILNICTHLGRLWPTKNDLEFKITNSRIVIREELPEIVTKGPGLVLLQREIGQALDLTGL